jgi:hypothetical protein
MKVTLCRCQVVVVAVAVVVAIECKESVGDTMAMVIKILDPPSFISLLLLNIHFTSQST